MGEAKRRLNLRDRVLRDCPLCIYCGGVRPAETVDHMPPVNMFTLRQRPRGLEFASCHQCNQGARLLEQVACLIGRVYPDEPSREGQAEIAKVMREVNNNHPGLFEEMFHDRAHSERDEFVLRQAPPGSGFLRTDGPLLSAAVSAFCAKLGFALHYEYTRQIVPPEGGVFARWYTNYNLAHDELPQDFIAMLGDQKTLRQGARHVQGQFLYASKGTEDGSMTAHFASFRIAFAAAAFAARDVAKLGEINEEVFRPGFLRERRA